MALDLSEPSENGLLTPDFEDSGEGWDARGALRERDRAHAKCFEFRQGSPLQPQVAVNVKVVALQKIGRQSNCFAPEISARRALHNGATDETAECLLGVTADLQDDRATTGPGCDDAEFVYLVETE